MLAFLDLAVKNALPCLLGPRPMVAPNPPGPMDFIDASAVNLRVLSTVRHTVRHLNI